MPSDWTARAACRKGDAGVWFPEAAEEVDNYLSELARFLRSRDDIFLTDGGEDVIDAFVKALPAIRKERGFSMGQLARVIGRDRVVFFRIEHGQRRPTMEEVIILALAMAVLSPKTEGADANTAYAIGVCRECPVRQECLDAGIGEPYGIWAGLTGPERMRLAARLTPEMHARICETCDMGFVTHNAASVACNDCNVAA